MYVNSEVGNGRGVNGECGNGGTMDKGMAVELEGSPINRRRGTKLRFASFTAAQ